MLIVLACAGGSGTSHTRALLLEALRRGYGMERIPAMSYGEHGKPWFPSAEQIHFNLSHSGPFALCAVSDMPVGVDIECVVPRAPGLARFALSESEYRWYTAHGGDWEAFYTLWTRKESWCKRTGGSVMQPRQIVPPLPGEALPHAPESFAGPGWRAAVCADGEVDGDIIWIDVTKLETDAIS